jgi:hypothetical protein
MTDIELKNGELIRSVSSCRYDLKRWGAKFSKNQKRPYFEGHERDDVVASRKIFVDFFLSIKSQVYQQTKSEPINWVDPSEDPPFIIICHDESTFRSGEQQSFKWIFVNNSCFFNKGQGRSLMLSYFLVQHKFLDIFELNEDEWEEAVRENPNLLKENNFVNYETRSANAYIEPGKDCYFNNNIILDQFERLFILLKYKKIFNNHVIIVIVDNACMTYIFIKIKLIFIYIFMFT